MNFYLRKLKLAHNQDCLYYNLDRPNKVSRSYLFTEWKVHYQDNVNSYPEAEKARLPELIPKIKEYIVSAEENISTNK